MRNLLMFAVMTMGAGVATAQPVQWRVEDGGNGHWYEIALKPTSTTNWFFADAVNYAYARGGYLVTLSDANENNFVADLYSNFSGTYWAWIGLQQTPGSREPDGGWGWVTEEPFTFTRWALGEPTDSGCNINGNHQSWGILRTDGTWDDLGEPIPNCNFMMEHAIIEWSADCNNDGIVDKGQILSGQLADANNNGVPDGPSIAMQPTDQTVGVNTPVTFIVEVASLANCSNPLAYQWQRRNPIISDSNAPGAWIDLSDVGGFFGTTAPNLSIARPTPAIATGYRCKITGGCGCEPNSGGVLYTNVVNFSVTCPSDFNADGSVDGDDVIQFFENWDGGC